MTVQHYKVVINDIVIEHCISEASYCDATMERVYHIKEKFRLIIYLFIPYNNF